MKSFNDLNLSTRIYRLSGTVVLVFLLVIAWMFLQIRENLIEAKNTEVRNIVGIGWEVVDYHVDMVQAGKLSKEEAQRRSLEFMARNRFDDGNYFWIIDETPRVLMNPLHPELMGENILEFQDTQGKQFAREIMRVIKNENNGSIEYLWPSPGRSEPKRKISYVKKVPEWDWIIGAGYHLENVNSYLWSIFLKSGTVLLIVIIGAFILVRYVSRSVSVPLNRAVKMIEALECGDLSSRLCMEQKDEVGRLSNALDAFADNLQYEILSAFNCLAEGDFTFEAKGLIREPLARANEQLNRLVEQLQSSIERERKERGKSEALIRAIGDGVVIFDQDMRIVYQNQVHQSHVGELQGRPCFEAHHPSSEECQGCNVKKSSLNGQVHQMERRLQKDGGEIVLESTTSPVMNSQGKSVGIIEITRDVTARKRAEQNLRESEARYANLFEGNAAVMLIIDPLVGVIVDANPAACSFYGYPKNELVGTNLAEINTLSGEEIFKEMEQAARESRRHFYFQHSLADGRIRDVEVFSCPVEVRGQYLLYSIIHDITKRKKAQEHVKYLSMHDSLTGLANRALLEDRLGQTMAQAQRHQESGAVFFLDLDRFKVINDSLGHQVGDKVLKEIAQRLVPLQRKGDTISRFGGDEFLLVLPRIDNANDAGKVARKIQQALEKPFLAEKEDIRLSFSIGITLYPHDGCDMSTLISNADMAMYEAKKRGRNNYQFFHPEMTMAAQERLNMEKDIRLALERDEFELYYQPQVDLSTNQITAVEALIRWRHPRKGMISPRQFIPIAEETGQILEIGEWVLRTACAQNRRWQQCGLPPMRIAVNVSGKQFQQDNFLELTDQVLEDTGLEPRWLEMEMTENVLMENREDTVRRLTEIRSRDISLSIDDFGTGYSSLNCLKQFPISKLKIDRSFLQNISEVEEGGDAAIATAIIGMAKALDLEVVAEGVETEAQVAFLNERNCHGGQGYYFCPPAHERKIGQIISDRSLRTREGAARRATVIA